MGKKLRVLLVPTAALALGLATALPAQAASGYDRCPDNYYCMFSGLDGTGDMIKVQGNTPDLGALDDQGSSDWNRTDETVHLYSGSNYGGCEAITSAGDRGNFYSGFQDFFSSLEVGGSGGFPNC